jgi:hypothetical protein
VSVVHIRASGSLQSMSGDHAPSAARGGLRRGLIDLRMPTMIAFKTVSIIHNGRSYTGTWLLDGKSLSVSSAYGSQASKIKNGGEAEAMARELLAELVEAWRP